MDLIVSVPEFTSLLGKVRIHLTSYFNLYMQRNGKIKKLA